MNELHSVEPNMANGLEGHGPRTDNISIRLVFSEEPDRKAPALIRELLQRSYINRLAAESRSEP